MSDTAGPSFRSTCRHLDASEETLKRFTAGLRWGRRVRRGEVHRDDDGDGDEEQFDSKRRKVCESGNGTIDELLS